jgi:hypothetical protein
MTHANSRKRRPSPSPSSRLRAAAALLAAAHVLLPIAPVAAQEEALDVTLRVLDDVSDIEGVLMPLEEEPEHRPDADSAPKPEDPPPKTEKDGVR